MKLPSDHRNAGRAGESNGDGCRWRRLNEAYYKKPAAEAARAIYEEKGVVPTPNWSNRETQTYGPALNGQDFFFLDELADPPADEIADNGHAHPDHEHVEARAEGAATGEHRPGRTNQEVRQHGERE